MKPVQGSVDGLLGGYFQALEGGSSVSFEDWLHRQPAALVGALREAWSDHQRAEIALQGDPDTYRRRLRRGMRLGSFVLVERLGEGGQAVVWEADQPELGRRVALKILPADRVSDREVALFEREAKAGARLQHPGIVAVYESGQQDGLAWIAQELVPGGRSLRELIDEERNAPARHYDWYRKVAKLIREVASALEIAHRAGVVHRDVKPQNILLTAAGEPKVSDFGLARVDASSALSQSGQQVGTYFYMSPEQVAAKPAGIDHRSDVFSLGVVMYELLTLRRPFEGDTAHQICTRIVDHDPPDPRVLRSHVPRDLAVICGKAMEKEPEKRYLSMADFAADIGRHLRSEPIAAVAPSRQERAIKWARRHPTRSSVIVVGGVALLTVVLLVLQLIAEKDRTRAFVDLLYLTESADEFYPVSVEAIPEMERWVEQAEAALRRGESSWSGLKGRAPEQDVVAVWIEQTLRNIVDPEVGVLDGISPEVGPGVRLRIELVRNAQSKSLHSAEAQVRWAEAIASIRDQEACPEYGGLELEPIFGLLPIGRDPGSGLWEFAHVMTGEPPERDANDVLSIQEESALVLVLLPGGEFLRGAQKTDPDAPNYDQKAVEEFDGPPTRVEVPPFFISKYEMSQGQWIRWNGENPSHHSSSNTILEYDLRHPVEQLSWEDCQRVLGRLALRLPTETEWEYAARAGTTTVWWTGDVPESLDSEKGANLYDMTADSFESLDKKPVEWEDGFVTTAPIDTLAPNPFGLHHVHGNVWEWCLDPFEKKISTHPPPNGGDSSMGVLRGGAFNSELFFSRSAKREMHDRSLRGWTLGVRPAMSLPESARNAR